MTIFDLACFSDLASLLSSFLAFGFGAEDALECWHVSFYFSLFFTALFFLLSSPALFFTFSDAMLCDAHSFAPYLFVFSEYTRPFFIPSPFFFWVIEGGISLPCLRSNMASDMSVNINMTESHHGHGKPGCEVQYRLDLDHVCIAIWMEYGI